MELHEYVSQVIINTKGAAGGLFSLPAPNSSLGVFLPELILCLTMAAMLFLRLFKVLRGLDTFFVMLLGSGAAFAVTAPWTLLVDANPATPVHDYLPRMEIFSGMLVYDGFTVFMRSILIGFAVLFTLFTKISGIPDREDGPDIYTLVLGSTLGMCLMASANHLMMVFMAVEMASVPSYVLAGLLKGRRQGSEAALKYSIYGAGAAGVMLYGISLVTGLVHTAHLPTVAIELSRLLPQMESQELMVLAIGGLMVMVGLAFKLSAVPFHFWAPDVFEGASAEIGSFLSISSKAAALALLVRVGIGFTGLVPAGVEAGTGEPIVRVDTAAGNLAASDLEGSLFALDDATAGPTEPSASDHKEPTEPAHESTEHAKPAHGASDEAVIGLSNVGGFAGRLIAFFAILTCTFGNLAAYGQTNIKRLLAYSTIAHAGYMMMAVPPLVAMAAVAPDRAEAAVAALGVYIGVYLFMNLGAFAIVAFLRNAMRSEQIDDYSGLLYRCPGVTICFALILFGLVGLPPLSGFVGKFAVFATVLDGYLITEQPYLMVVLVAGGMNTAISLFYYLRVVRVMTMQAEPESRTPFTLPLLSLPGIYICLITLPTVVLILFWNTLNELATSAANNLLQT